MRLLSLEAALRSTRETLNRFPLGILSALVAAATAATMVDGPTTETHPRLLATAILGMALFTASVTSAERRGIAVRHRWVADQILAAGLALLFLASRSWTDDFAALRFAQLLVAAHLLVAVAPYLTTQRLDGFWQFNRILFERFLIGAFYAAVLFVGLAIALGAIDKLFAAKIPGDAYGYLFVTLAFVFHPWFFLAGVPRDHALLEQLEDYPSGLKVFTQFVLLPLVVVYLLILTAYLGKVIVTRSWPSGWIGYLVSSVSATGVLALLLLHPIRERADSRWVNAYGRWWFVALLPSLGMLLAAILKRIGQYGVTEQRYFLLVLACWLSGLAVYYGITASRNIKLIPMTLCAVALLTATGPWSAFAVSRRSQVGRLDHILERNGMGRAGQPTPARATLPLEDRREMSAVLSYLASTHGSSAVAEVIGLPKDSVARWSDTAQWARSDALASRAMDRLGVRYVTRAGLGGRGTQVWANRQQAASIPVTGYEVVLPVSFPSRTWIGTAVDSLEVVVGDSTGILSVRREGAPVMSLDVAAAVARALPDSGISGPGTVLQESIIVDGEGGGYRLRLRLDHVAGELVDGRFAWRTGSGMLLAAGFRSR